MFSNRRSMSLATLILTMPLLLTACSGGNDGVTSTHSSPSGLMLEEHVPSSVALMFSYSLLDAGQYEQVQLLEDSLNDVGRLSNSVSSSFDEIFADTGLDYETDLKPAFGEQFRLLYGVEPGVEESTLYAVATLADVERMELVFETLTGAGQLDEKKLSETEAYVNETEGFYAAVEEDLLLVSTTADGLVDMLEMDKEDSLWENDLYKDALNDVGDDHVFYGVMFAEALQESGAGLPGAVSAQDLSSVVDYQSLVVRADDRGLEFDVVIQANEEKANESGVSFDDVPRSEPYLFAQVPVEGVMAYFETYGIAETLRQADNLGDETGTIQTLSDFTVAYLGMDFEDEIMSFMDQGAAIAVHTNGDGAFPGISIMVDASSDPASAEQFVSELGAQVSAYASLLGASLEGAFTFDPIILQDGTEMQAIQFNMNAIPRTEENAHLSLPEAVTSSEIQLAYGMMGDTMMITTSSVWDGRKGGFFLNESTLYVDIQEQMGELGDGLILINANGITDYLDTLSSLRSELGLETEAAANVDFEELLDGFFGAMATSTAEEYRSHISGYLMLD